MNGRKKPTLKYKASDAIVRDHLLDAKMHLKEAEDDLNGISDALRHKVDLLIAEINMMLGVKG